MPKHDYSARAVELLIPILLAAVPAALMAIAGFVFGIFLCSWLFTGEATESALIVGPATGLLFGVATFFAVFRWIIHYGDPPSRVD